MFSKFLKLNPEKQARILNAALKEFAHKGFKNASTDAIAKEANISKGALFHYFNSKKDLFLFLYDHSLELILKEFYGKIDRNEKDVFERWRHILALKFELVRKYPDLFHFIQVSNDEDADEVKMELEERNKKITESSYEKLFEGIDASKFREGLDIQKAIRIMIWTMEGLRNQEREKSKRLPLHEYDYDGIMAEAERYLDLLRNCFYK